MKLPLIIKKLGKTEYVNTWKAMQEFTATRTNLTTDELWVTEHLPVFTQGQAGKPEHLLKKSNIPVIKTDRGGQITYHGPGQIIFYPLLNLKKNHLNIKKLVESLETIIIRYLSTHGVQGERKEKAPGVYVQQAKIASLGLRIKRGCCYHGLSFNVNMNLTPFSMINPCGLLQQPITQLNQLAPTYKAHTLTDELLQLFLNEFNYQAVELDSHCSEDNHERINIG